MRISPIGRHHDHRLVNVLASTVAAVLLAAAAHAHETEQFTPPPNGQQLADVGLFLNEYFMGRLQESLDEANDKIERALERNGTPVPRSPSDRPSMGNGTPPSLSEVSRLQTTDGIVSKYRNTFYPGPVLIEKTEKDIKKNKKLKAENPDDLLVWKVKISKSVYKGTSANPLTLFARGWRGGTIKAYDTYVGTDKIGHFVDFGYRMYGKYRKNLGKGMPPDEAMRKAVDWQVGGAGGEKGFYGKAVVGAYSNGDLASNYVGCLFFRNLTEPIVLKGQLRPAILERDGPYWRIADHARDPQFISWFITDHFDEALNPSLYRKGMRKRLRKNVKARHSDILRWYADPSGRTRSKAWFDNKLKEVSTYYGVDYGHDGSYNELVSIGSTWPVTSPQ